MVNGSTSIHETSNNSTINRPNNSTNNSSEINSRNKPGLSIPFLAALSYFALTGGAHRRGGQSALMS